MIVVRCDIETILKSLDSHLDWFHKRSFPSNFRNRISWGFNVEVVGLGLVKAIMVRNSEFLDCCSWLYLLHAWLLHMEYSELFKICGGWGLECYGRHGRWSKMLILRAAGQLVPVEIAVPSIKFWSFLGHFCWCRPLGKDWRGVPWWN